MANSHSNDFWHPNYYNDAANHSVGSLSNTSKISLGGFYRPDYKSFDNFFERVFFILKSYIPDNYYIDESSFKESNEENEENEEEIILKSKPNSENISVLQQRNTTRDKYMLNGLKKHINAYILSKGFIKIESITLYHIYLISN